MEKGNILDKFWVMLFKIPIVKKFWLQKYQAMVYDSVPWAKLKKPIPSCKIVLVTTGGIVLKTEEGFDLNDPKGDSSFRRIPYDVSTEDLTISHKYYDHRDADLDPNLILPFEVLRELQKEGIVGASAPYFYSFMGHIQEPHLTTLIQESAVEVAKEIKRLQVDIALLVPA